MKSLFVFALVGCAAAHAPVTPSCANASLEIGGDRIWVDREGAGKLTVVFEAGFGNDSSVWSAITPRVRATGVQTFVYDRAGTGKSTIDATPYSMDHDVGILRSALDRCGVAGPIVMVGHSYGGAISLVMATADARVHGVVLLDAMVPHAWSQATLDENLVKMRAQYDEIRKQEPQLAKVAIPWAEALPTTIRELDGLTVAVPIIDIVAEKGHDDEQAWTAAHEQFTANHAEREHVGAASGHKVMLEQPDLVVDAIHRMVGR